MPHSLSFPHQIYSIVCQIPCGKVLTYGQIARLAGKPSYARMVGRAMANAPEELNLPCHRVVNGVGRLAPSWPEQRKLLENEGVAFRKNGCVDMQKSAWRTDDLLLDEK